MTSTTITIRTDTGLAKKIAALAAAKDRSRNWVIEDALKRYIAVEQAQAKGIEDALAWFDTHKGIPHDQIMKDVDALLAEYGVPRHGKKP